MKKAVALLVAMLIVCAGTALAADKVLKIFIWSEYMDEVNMPKAFEKATGIKVKLDLYESN